jgi:hypothetical protein
MHLRRLFARFPLLEHLQVYPCSVFALCMLYAIQGAVPERDSSLTLSMQLVELCKASGRRGSGGGYYGFQDYLRGAPLAFKRSKDVPGETSKAAVKQIKRYARPQKLCDPCVLTHHHPNVAREERAPWTL